MADLTQVAENVIRGQAPKVKQLVENSLAENIPVGKILNEGLIAGMNVVGEKFKNNEFHIPEVLIAARAMKSGMELIRPLLSESGIEPVGTVAIGTVKGDLHDIGKNLVMTCSRKPASSISSITVFIVGIVVVNSADIAMICAPSVSIAEIN